MSKLQAFREKWAPCTRCPLHKDRFKTVLYRGDIPCDVLFIGEAPGASEDIAGKPFVGPAGKLFDQIIQHLEYELFTADYYATLRYALTNVVCCWPQVTEESIATGYDKPTTPIGGRAPRRDEILACRPRLIEFVNLCNPKLIITVGKISKTALTGTKDTNDSLIKQYPIHSIIHPSAILYMGDKGFDAMNAEQELHFKRAVSRLTAWIQEYIPL